MSSGSRNPLRFFELYEWIRAYFEEHPLPERGRGEHKVPEWDFPGNLTVERMLRRAERLTDIAEQVVTHLPKSKAMRDAVRRVDRDKARVDFVKRYSDLYGMYTETEVVYTDDRTLALFESLSAEDKATFPFDAAMVDWKYYLQDVHSPAVTQSLRELSKRDRERPTVTIREREEPVLALFDMEGTIISSNVVESYVWARMADLTPEEWPRELASVFGRIPGYLQIDRRDRGDFLRTFFRRYEGASVEGIDRLVSGHVAEFMLQKASAAAIRRIREHRAAGHRTILITAAAEAFVRPLSPLFDVVIGAELEQRDGRYTGFMSAPPLVGEARAAWLRRYALLEGIELQHSYAYADSYSDLPAAAGGGQPGRGVSRRVALPLRAPPPLADRGMGHDQGHAAGAFPQAGGAHVRAVRRLMALALEYFRSMPRYVGARVAGRACPGLVAGGPLAPLRLVTQADPEPRGDGLGAPEADARGHLRQRPLDDRR